MERRDTSLRIVLSLLRFFFPLKLLKYVCSHAFVANSLSQWIVDMGTTKHIVQDKASLMEFYCYPVGSQTVVLGSESEKDVLREGTY